MDFIPGPDPYELGERADFDPWRSPLNPISLVPVDAFAGIVGNQGNRPLTNSRKIPGVSMTLNASMTKSFILGNDHF